MVCPGSINVPDLGETDILCHGRGGENVVDGRLSLRVCECRKWEGAATGDDVERVILQPSAPFWEDRSSEVVMVVEVPEDEKIGGWVLEKGEIEVSLEERVSRSSAVSRGIDDARG